MGEWSPTSIVCFIRSVSPGLLVGLGNSRSRKSLSESASAFESSLSPQQFLMTHPLIQNYILGLGCP